MKNYIDTEEMKNYIDTEEKLAALKQDLKKLYEVAETFQNDSMTVVRMIVVLLQNASFYAPNTHNHSITGDVERIEVIRENLFALKKFHEGHTFVQYFAEEYEMILLSHVMQHDPDLTGQNADTYFHEGKPVIGVDV